MHASVPVNDSVEVIETTAISPLISKCQIKVCYVGEEPNRNKTIITKEVASKMGETLRGCPIVGYYMSEEQDFDAHSREIEITEDGEFALVDLTKPYGFVDVNANVWFQKFIDDGEVEREYLCTEGYIWTDIYQESKRIIEKGNNQSMEISPKNLKGNWTNAINSSNRFFIINEGIIEKLCILGENVEPCFEGAQIKKEFSLQEEFTQLKNTMFAMIEELKQERRERNVYTEYAVETGCHLADAIFEFCWSKNCRLYGIYEEDGQKFFVTEGSDLVLTRYNFAIDESNGFTIEENGEQVSISFESITKNGQEAFTAFAAAKEDGQKDPSKDDSKDETDDPENTEESETEDACGGAEKEPKKDNACGDKEKEPEKDNACNKNEEEDSKKKYAEYEQQIASLKSEFELLKQENESLREFKLAKEREAKETLIASFNMLSEEDKADVVTNIDTYSLDDIEAKLSILCVRNKVNFNLEQAAETNETLTYNLSASAVETNTAVPEWVKLVKKTQEQI